MRQLESTERQNRARAAAWAEVETKLRSDLEDNIVSLENVTREKNNLVSSDKRMQRLLKEKAEEIASSRETIDGLNATIETLETRLEELEEGGKILKQELIIAERKASEGASKVRSEMMQTLVESEERYRSQIDALEEELDVERHGRVILEKQLDDLVESVSAAKFAQNHAGGGQRSPDKEKKLLSATDQASILQDTLAGFDSDVDDDDGNEVVNHRVQGQGGSFAAMEQLTLGLNGAKAEIDALRKQLVTSEESRAILVEELGEARQAVEKLPLFEQRVSELTMEIKLRDMEIQGLQDDIADVRFLYRTQLDALLEEKATTTSPMMQSDEDKRRNVIVINDDSN
jgi:chromosome segregation ATPase